MLMSFFMMYGRIKVRRFFVGELIYFKNKLQIAVYAIIQLEYFMHLIIFSEME